MYSSALKPFVLNGTDIGFLLDQVRFRPLFDANHNAIINWDGTTKIYDGYGNLLYAPPVGETAGSATALAAIEQWGTSYQTVVDLTGIRDVSGANNNLAGVNWQWGGVDQIFPRMAPADYSNYAVATTGKVNGIVTGLSSNDYAISAVQGSMLADLQAWILANPTLPAPVAVATRGDGSHEFFSSQSDLVDWTADVDNAGWVAQDGLATTSDGTFIYENVVSDSSARTISRLTTTGGVEFDTWANHASDPDAPHHAPNEIYYNADGVATVLNWGDIGVATLANPNGMGQYDTQARFIGSAGAGATGSLSAGADATKGDQYIGGLNPGVSPSNGFFVLFGQFFDHGLDFIGKGEQGKTIKITLAADDPLYGMIGPDGQPTRSITISRANVATLDANGDPQYTDHTSPYIDQSQTYGSHQQLTDLLREWVQDPVTGDWKPGISMLDGHTLQTAWKNAAGVMVYDTLPTLNELRAHVEATGRDALTWEDVLDLHKRDANGHIVLDEYDDRINTGSALILDSNPRFDYNHLHGIHDYNNDNLITANEYSSNADQRAAVDAAIAYLGNHANAADTGLRAADSFGMVGDVLTLTLGSALEAYPGDPNPIQAGTYTGASALMMWVNFADFSIMAPPGLNIAPEPGSNAHDAVSEILMASVGDHYIAGDGRVNENFGLTSIHHVFHEEHNFQVQNLMDAMHRDAIATGDYSNLHSFQIDTGNGVNASGDYVNATGEVTWDLDKMFQATKLIVEMEYQHAAVDQYARNVTPNIQEFVGYSPDKDPSVTLEYAQSAFRFGHSTLRETIDTIDPTHGLTGKIMGYALRAAFLNPDTYADIGPASVLLGMSHQQMNDVDEFVTPALNQGLLGQPLDLAAINIARGRDIGIPTLSDLREALGLAAYTSWNDFGNNMQHPTSLVNFIAAYSFSDDAPALALSKAQAIMGLADGSILETDLEAMGYTIAEAIAFLDNDATLADSTNATDLNLAGRMGAFGQIDSWLGGLAEIHQPGGLLGETFDKIFVAQIESLMDGDRFYYLYRLAGQQFAEEVGNGQLKDIVERNTGLTHLNGNIFGYADKYYDFGANREVTDGVTETNTTSNNHKYGDVVDQNGMFLVTNAADPRLFLAIPTARLIEVGDPEYADLIKLGANGGIGALTTQNTVSKAGNFFMNGGAGVGIYTNGGRSTALDGSIIKVGGVAYVRDTRMEDHGADTGAADLNGGTNLDGTPNSGAESNELIVGTKWGDMIYAQGGDDTVYGDGGNDIIYGGYGIDRLYGGDGSDKLYGGDNPDLMDGGAGDDFLYGESSGSDINGADQLIGGSGNDFISGGIGIDKLSGGSGDDHIMGDQDTDPFTHGSDGNDLVEGNSGGDILYGDNGDDVVEGGADQDQLFGGLGDDILRPGNATGALTIGTDEVLGNDGVTEALDANGKVIGFDIIDFSDNTVRPGGVFFDLSSQGNPGVAVNGNPIQVPSFQIEGVVGSAGDDTLIGGSDHLDPAGNDVADDDWIIGANGNDTLQGGLGNDVIIGGSIRLDALIGKYNSSYDHNNVNDGAEALLAHPGMSTEDAIALQDALYQGASHRVAWDAAIDSSGIIDKVNSQFNLTGTDAYAKHFTEMLRSDQFKNIVLGNAGSETANGAGGGVDTLVLTGNIGDYTFQAIHANANGTGAVIGLRVKDNGFVDPNDPNNNRASEGSDVVLGVTNFKFANGATFTQSQLVPPNVSVNDVTIAEGNSGTANATFTISLDHAYFAAVTVTYVTVDGTAHEPGDYTALPSTTVTIPAGSTSVTVDVPVVGDTKYEVTETFDVKLTAATNAVIIDAIGVGTITDVDPMPSLSISNVSITEGDAGTKLMTFTVHQSAQSGMATSVNWATSNGTATAGSDYDGASGTLNIAAGSTSGTFTVTIKGDTAVEANETLNVTLTSPVNATLANTSATGTILNDDRNLTESINIPANTALPGTGIFGSMAIVPDGSTTYGMSNISSPGGGSFSVSSGGTLRRTGSAMTEGQVYSFDITATQGSVLTTETITIKTGTAAAGETLNAAAGDSILYGLAGNDTLNGGAGDDNLFGQDGDDIVVGGGGNDYMNGGGGSNDTAVVSGSRYDYKYDVTSNGTFTTTDARGIDGTDLYGSDETMRFGGIAGTDNLRMAAFGLAAGDDLVIGSNGNNTAMNGLAGNDIIVAGGGDDIITWNVGGGRDLVIGGSGTDTFVIQGDNALVEDYYIYTKAEFLNVFGNAGAVLGADTAIVITRNGSGVANIISELSGIEEIKINTTTNTNRTTTAANTTLTGPVSHDNVHVIGDFTGTGLAYNTISVTGSNTTVDITQLASQHRVVLDTAGGTGSIVGQTRAQDLINGVSVATGVASDTTTGIQHLQDQVGGTPGVMAVPFAEAGTSVQHLQDQVGGTPGVTAVPLADQVTGILGNTVDTNLQFGDIYGTLQSYLSGQNWNPVWSSERVIQPDQLVGPQLGLDFGSNFASSHTSIADLASANAAMTGGLLADNSGDMLHSLHRNHELGINPAVDDLSIIDQDHHFLF